MSVNTPSTIAKLEELLGKATPGPWVVERGGIDLISVDGIYTRDEIKKHNANSSWKERIKIVETDGGYYPPGEDDAELICLLRNSIQDLLDERKRLREGLEAIQDLELSSSHDMRRVKYTDDEEVGYCEATKIAEQSLAGDGGGAHE